MMAEIGKYLLLFGVVLAVVGAVLWGLGRAGFRGLPGDIRYESDNVRIYFPIVTSIILSIALTALVWLWQWISRR